MKCLPSTIIVNNCDCYVSRPTVVVNRFYVVFYLLLQLIAFRTVFYYILLDILI